MRVYIEEFSFGNFRSFKEINTLRMTAANIKSRNEEIDKKNTFTQNNSKLLTSKIVYGANASGKSNIIKAFIAFRSYLRTDKYLFSKLYDPFKYIVDDEKETYFQIILHYDDIKYRYGFEVDEDKILSEWLFINHNKREVPVFLRENNKIIDISKTHMSKGHELAHIESKLFTDKMLFLTLSDNFNDETAEKVMQAINSILVYEGSSGKIVDNENNIADKLLEDSEFLGMIAKLLKVADTSIDDLKVKIDDNNEDKLLKFSIHKTFDNYLKEIGKMEADFINTESLGTQKYLSFTPLLSMSLILHRPILIDEFGSNLHPLLVKYLFSAYNSGEESIRSQIIAVTHHTDLMSSDSVRKDQIDLVEKDQYGRSYLYSLAEIKGIRNTSSFEEDYIRGKYGAIPFLGNIKDLVQMEDTTDND